MEKHNTIDNDQTSGKSEDNPRAHKPNEQGFNMPNTPHNKEPRDSINDPDTNPVKGKSYQPSSPESNANQGTSRSNSEEE
ncbi:MAG: hypothetical protein M3Q97_07765 [Bacteroidota bacterium]|nr:hypothetical protein [Bacteroidota bacterium]